jgi:enoyl-[acyl-carrier-protein] reductase (NADH)
MVLTHLQSQVAAAYGNYILLEELVQELKEESGKFNIIVHSIFINIILR